MEEKKTEYRALLHFVGENVNSSLKELKFQCLDWIGKGKMETIQSTLDLLIVLEERDKVSEEDVTFLEQILKNIKRNDMARLVRTYQNKWNITKTWFACDEFTESSTGLYKNEQSIPGNTAFGNFGSVTDQKYNQIYEKNIEVSQSTKFYDDFLPTLKALPVEMTNNSEAPIHLNQPYENLPELNHLDDRMQTLLRFVSENLAHSWKMTMRYLNVPDHVIEMAISNWPHNLRKAILEALVHWTRYEPPTVEILVAALRRSNRNDLADQVQEHF